MITLTFIAIALLLALYYYNYDTRLLAKKIKQIPGPPDYPFLGNCLQCCVSNNEIFNLIRKLSNEYYPTYKLIFPTGIALSIRHPDDIEILLSSKKHITKAIIYEFLHPWLGTGLLTSTGDKWYHRRKILTPTFHFNILQQFLKIINEKSEWLIKSLQAQNGAVVKDVFLFTSEFTLNTICETAMGISLESNDTEYREAVHSLGQIVIHRLFRPWLYFDFLFQLTPKGWQQMKLLKVLHSFTKKIIAERKNFHDETLNCHLENIENRDGGTTTYIDERNKFKGKRLAMLDLLIAASRNRGEINDEGIREEVDTFTFEGHDTTASGLSFTLLVLSKYKDVQARAREEIDAIWLENNGNFTVSELVNLSYLERCIKEVLRLYPSVPTIGRKITEDLHLKNYVLPAGVFCYIHIYDVHRDAKLWPNPNTFDPDRFLPDTARNRHPFSYIPFSAGSRNCIGQKFAMMELKCSVAYILRHFYLEPVEELDNVQMVATLTLQPSKPIHIKFISRNQVPLNNS